MAEKKQVEVLAPAGSYESMEAAFAAGADAVYIGGSRFGARAYADNLDKEMLCRAIDYAHLHGRRLYMTVNTLFKEQELKELPEYILPYDERGLDAVIVQDLGAMAVIREYFPELPVHASTQMTITGVYGAKKLKELGASRVVTARELSLDEIRQIHQQVDIEIESFVHGALCYCYSGQCLMSSLIGGRSGNRGRCAQPCRLPYEVWQKDKRLNKKQESFVLSMKDLCTLDLLPDILEAGVYSLKIEGRMKSPRYTAGVTSVYRKYVDQYLAFGREGYWVDPKDKQMLLDLFDRGGFTEGYYTQHNGKSMLALKEKPAFREVNQQLFEEIDQKWVKKKLQEPISGCIELTPGERAKLILSKETEFLSKIGEKKDLSEDKKGKIQAVVYGQEVQAAQKQPMSEETISRQMNKTGNTPFYFADLTVVLNGDVFLPLQALNELRRRGLEELENQMLSVHFRQTEAMGMSEMRESGNTEREEKNNIKPEEKGRYEQEYKAEGERGHESEDQQPYLVTSVEEVHQLPPVLNREEIREIYIDADGFSAELWKKTVIDCHQRGKKCLLLMPEIFRQEAIRYFAQNQRQLDNAGFDGFVVRSLEEAEWIKEQVFRQSKEGNLLDKEADLDKEVDLDKKVDLDKEANVDKKADLGKETCLKRKMPFLVFDTSLYTWNHRAVQAMEEAGAGRITVPSELNGRELRERGIYGQEMMIYGRLPMMLSAQCIQKTVQGCSKKRGEVLLKDRTGKEMPVKNRCRFCYNTIYNASPLSLLGQERLVEELKPKALRLHFTNETQKEVEKLLAAFIDGFYYRRVAEFPLCEFTRGHMKRGVE